MKHIILQEEEHILAQTRKHWMVFLRDAGSTLGIGAALFILLGLITLPNSFDLQNQSLLTIAAFAEILWILIIWIAIVAIWTNYYLDIWIVTNLRVVNTNQIGLFERSITMWQFKDIQEITTEMSNPLQTFLNYGLIHIRTASPTEKHAHMEGIPYPGEMSELILEQMETYRTLEKTAEKQETLLHTISHETKAHLTKNEAALASIIEGDYGEIPEKLKLMVRDALAETRTGVGMVMNILSSSDFKTGALKLNVAPFDFSTTVQTVSSELGSSAEQKNLTLSCSIQNASHIVDGDESKLKEHVVRNLIDNAIRYTPHGSVKVSVARVEDAVLLIVDDTGVGISNEDLPKLFTEGGKGEHSTDINPSSTGFGLFIARQIVEAHGGAIWAESAGANRGSTFYVALPAKGSSQGEGAV